MQGANSIKNVANSRDACINMVRQKQHGHKQKQGFHSRSQQQQKRRQQQGCQQQHGMPETAWTQTKQRIPQGANSIKNVGNSRDVSNNMVRQKQHGRTQAKTGTSCREPTTLRMSPTAGMPAATWCAKKHGHKQKQGLHAGSQQH
jgi:hypothetical protein